VCTYHLFDDKHHPFPPLANGKASKRGSGKGSGYYKGNMRREVREGERLNAPAESLKG